MPNHDAVSRRIFLERLAAGALAASAGAVRPAAAAPPPPGAWTAPPALKNPNILIVMVDQMRPPMWMNAGQSAALAQSVLPNIVGRIRSNAYSFEQFFVSATQCTASRGTLLTGLYAPQTAMYLNADPGAPPLNPAFPTWGQALPALNPAYKDNVWWFGKWHLSSDLNGAPLLPYGFRTSTYPGGPAPYNGDPTGVPNEGTDGGLFDSQQWANDAMIAADFIGWLQGQGPTGGVPAPPWCATVSLINPHDICGAPAWFQSNPFPPAGVISQPTYFPAPGGTPPPFYTSVPSPWNYENPQQTANKPGLQSQWAGFLNKDVGSVASWTTYLNQYLWLQNFVDQQVGLVLNALANSPFASNTVVIFLSDHGEFAGSHGLRQKGFAVYEEAIRAPLYVMFPGQTGSIMMSQMCAGVDLFGLICDLACGGSGQWRLAYPDLANRQSLWSFLYRNSRETRVAPAPIGLPYIFHTFEAKGTSGKIHIVCMRTKSDPDSGAAGAKLAFYSQWASGTTYPDSTPPDPEFYDYSINSSEMGNDYFSTNPNVAQNLARYVQVMGSLGPASSGLIGSELNLPLVGSGTDGNPLSQAQTAARTAYYSYLTGGSGT